MESPILQRVIQIIKELNLTDNQFSKRLKIAQTTMSGYLSGNRKLSLQVIESVLSEFEDISAEWLLRGEGEMYKADDKNINDNFDKSQYVSIKKYESIVNLFGQTASELKDMAIENKMLYDEIRKLKEQLVSAKSA